MNGVHRFHEKHRGRRTTWTGARKLFCTGLAGVLMMALCCMGYAEDGPITLTKGATPGEQAREANALMAGQIKKIMEIVRLSLSEEVTKASLMLSGKRDELKGARDEEVNPSLEEAIQGVEELQITLEGLEGQILPGISP